jgi:hypothetical protein
LTPKKSPVDSGVSEMFKSQIPLVVHCLLDHKEDRWEAYSLEFGLAAQAESEQVVKQKLENMVVSYLYDALGGEDKEHAVQLLRRRATFSVYAQYYVAWLFCHFKGGNRRDGTSHRTYNKAVPLVPINCAA